MDYYRFLWFATILLTFKVGFNYYYFLRYQKPYKVAAKKAYQEEFLKAEDYAVQQPIRMPITPP